MDATAFVVGPVDGPGAGLTDLARQLGFSRIMPYGGTAAAERQAAVTPLCFFLFAAVADVEELREAAQAVRFSTRSRIRFSPLIYFSQSPSTQAIMRCINMGFDDVITLPFTPARVAERVDRQLGQTLVYYETPGYFGPDRRDRVTSPSRAGESRLGGQFRRIEIIRKLDTGVTVVRDDLYSQATLL